MGSIISPLRRAVRANRPERVREILDTAGCSSSDLINDDFTADCVLDVFGRNASPVLHTAIGYQRLDIAEILLEYGAAPDARGPWQETPLHKAARQNDLALARLLLQHGAALYVQDENGSFPVHLAALSLIAGYLHKNEVLHYLVDTVGKAEDVNLEDDDENTPLHNAALRGNYEACRYLLSKGAKPDPRNVKGASPYDLTNSARVKALLLEATKAKGH